MPRIIDLEQGSEDWLEWRQKHLGGSDANIIAAFFLHECNYPYGKGPIAELYKLFCLKTGRNPVKPSKDRSWGDYIDPLVLGHKLEPIARDWYVEETGNFCEALVLEHDTLPYLSASLDGYIDFSRIIEIKCPQEPGPHREALEGHVPDAYWPQLQHNLFVAGADICDYVSFSHRTRTGVIIPVKRDEEFIVRLREAEDKFWAWVQANNFPVPEASEVERNDAEWGTLLDDYFVAQSMSREAEKMKRRAERAIMANMTARKVHGHGVTVSLNVVPARNITPRPYRRDERIELSIRHTVSVEDLDG
jgi:putative phage-type endonuclease